MIKLGTTSLSVHPLCLGGNVFGWSADRDESFAVLDAYAAAGGNFIDTADVYSAWKDGNVGGESETIIGEWMEARDNRDAMVIATKVGKLPGLTTLNSATITTAAEASLKRLRTDHIDLYYAHDDDASTPLGDTLAAFATLVAAGKVRHIAASNFTAERLGEALDVAAADGVPAFEVLQPRYNLLDREFEGGLRDVCLARQVAVVPYYGLARGFLSGKYRPGTVVDSVRSAGAAEYLDDRGLRVLEVLDDMTMDHDAPVGAIALAWLAAQPSVAAPIASARTVEQLAELMVMADIDLTRAEVERLSQASQLVPTRS